jgi:RNA polymerase sporulation-specific sigma factor
MQSFPQPPSAKEEKEYMRRCHQGDKEARNLLIERNLRLVAYIARKYSAKERDMDDLISIGTIGLIKAVDSFDENKGLRLASYASRCIENELLMHMRTTKKTARDVYLYDSIGSDKEGNEINLLDIIRGRGCSRALDHRTVPKMSGRLYGKGTDIAGERSDLPEVWLGWQRGKGAEGGSTPLSYFKVICIKDRKKGIAKIEKLL